MASEVFGMDLQVIFWEHIFGSISDSLLAWQEIMRAKRFE